MKLINRSINLLIIICLLTFCISCSYEKKSETRGEISYDPITEEKKSLLEKASASYLVELYIKALNDGDIGLALATHSPEYVERYEKQELIKIYSKIKEAHSPKITVEKKYNDNSIKFMVCWYQVHEDEIMLNGYQVRFITVTRASPVERWYIEVLGTSP